MKDLFQLARLERQLEGLKAGLWGTTNLNTIGSISEDAFSRFMTHYTGRQHLHLGGNTKGYDVQCTVTGLRYEVKSTRTTVQTYNYGNLEGKDAEYVVFIKWAYDSDLTPEYLLVYPMTVVQLHLNQGYRRFTSTVLKQTRHLAQDLSQPFADYVALYRDSQG